MDLVLTNLFKKFCTGLITGLMKDLVGLLKQLSLNTSIFQRIDRSLSGSSYVKLPVELRNSKKGLINIKNNDQKRFL